MGSGTPGRASPNELKEVKAKLVNVQFDLKERDIRIQSLMNKLLTLQSSLDDFSPPKQGSFTESSGMSKVDSNGDSYEMVSMRGKLLKAEDELRNAKSDVERLQTEKNEAEVAGKGFMERFVSPNICNRSLSSLHIPLSRTVWHSTAWHHIVLLFLLLSYCRAEAHFLHNEAALLSIQPVNPTSRTKSVHPVHDELKIQLPPLSTHYHGQNTTVTSNYLL